MKIIIYAVVGVQKTDSFMMEVFHQQHDLIQNVCCN